MSENIENNKIRGVQKLQTRQYLLECILNQSTLGERSQEIVGMQKGEFNSEVSPKENDATRLMKRIRGYFKRFNADLTEEAKIYMEFKESNKYFFDRFDELISGSDKYEEGSNDVALWTRKFEPFNELVEKFKFLSNLYKENLNNVTQMRDISLRLDSIEDYSKSVRPEMRNSFESISHEMSSYTNYLEQFWQFCDESRHDSIRAKIILFKVNNQEPKQTIKQ